MGRIWHRGAELAGFTTAKQYQLTPRGRTVASLPVHPRVGHMLIWAAEHGAAKLACRLPELKTKLTPHLERRASQLQQHLSVKADKATHISPAVLLAQAYPDWIAQRRPGEPGNFRLACGAGVMMHSEDALAHSQWLVVAELGGAGSQLRIFKALELNVPLLTTSTGTTNNKEFSRSSA